MPFGIATAPEIFQLKLQTAIGGLKGVFSIVDDILIVGEGSTDEEASTDHDHKLQQFLDRCRQTRIQLNKQKFRLRMKNIADMPTY